MKSDGFLWLLNTSVALHVKPGYRLRIVAHYCTMELQWSSPTAILIQTHVIMTVTVPCDLKCSLYSKHKSRSQKSYSPVASLTGFSILLLTFKVCETTSPLSELLKLTLSIDIHPHHLTAWVFRRSICDRTLFKVNGKTQRCKLKMEKYKWKNPSFVPLCTIMSTLIPL